MISSIAPTTLKQYCSSLQFWNDYTIKNKINVFSPTVPEIIKFLDERFNDSASYGTLNSTRSAISLISNNNVGKNQLISRFLKGVYNKRPNNNIKRIRHTYKNT